MHACIINCYLFLADSRMDFHHSCFDEVFLINSGECSIEYGPEPLV